MNAQKNGAFENAFDQCERTRTEVFEDALKSGYSQKKRFLKTYLISVSAQKWRFLKTLQHSTIGFTKTEQCERTKTDVFPSVFVEIPGSFDLTKTDTNKNGAIASNFYFYH